jgi:hypothetical protein
MTPAGEVALSDLRPGDRLVTRDAGARPLQRIVVTEHEALRPCVIDAHALGHGRPGLRIEAGPDQTVLLRDWRARALFGQGTAMVALHRLIDGVHIRRAAAPRPVRFLWPDLGGDHVIYIDGLEFGLDRTQARHADLAPELTA